MDHSTSTSYKRQTNIIMFTHAFLILNRINLMSIFNWELDMDHSTSTSYKRQTVISRQVWLG